jgi:hypothetical protein
MANEDRDEDGGDQPRHSTSAFSGLVVAWIVSGAVGFVFNVVLRGYFGESDPGFGGRAAEAASYVIAGLAGGYAAGALIRRQPVVFGSIAGLLAVGNSLLMQSMWRPLTAETLGGIGSMTLLATIMAASVAGAYAFVILDSRRAGY